VAVVVVEQPLLVSVGVLAVLVVLA